jgi:ketosteroid isomerase-like protein
MKNLLIFHTLIFFAGCLHAQSTNTSAEAEVRNFEEAERRALLKKDINVLKQLWSKDLIVNGSDNRVVLAGEGIINGAGIAVLSYASFTREIEEILVKGDVVFSMGNEIVVPDADNPKEQKEIKRKYTNIWMKEDGAWKLVARHSSVICK